MRRRYWPAGADDRDDHHSVVVSTADLAELIAATRTAEEAAPILARLAAQDGEAS